MVCNVYRSDKRSICCFGSYYDCWLSSLNEKGIFKSGFYTFSCIMHSFPWTAMFEIRLIFHQCLQVTKEESFATPTTKHNLKNKIKSWKKGTIFNYKYYWLTCFLITYSHPASAFRRSTFSSCCFASFMYATSSFDSLHTTEKGQRKRQVTLKDSDTMLFHQTANINAQPQIDNIGWTMKRWTLMVTSFRQGHLSSLPPTFVWLRGNTEIISRRTARYTPQ